MEDGTASRRMARGKDHAGEVIFNTSHGGSEDIATDPSYFGQIMVMSAPMQGNYGVDRSFWESRQLWIEGFIALDINKHDTTWIRRLEECGIPTLNAVDTRALVLHLRDKGTLVGALVKADTEKEAREKSKALFARHNELPADWVHHVTQKEMRVLSGASSSGPRVALIDYGTKQNIVRSFLNAARRWRVPSRKLWEIQAWKPDGILLSNGPGDPAAVEG